MNERLPNMTLHRILLDVYCQVKKKQQKQQTSYFNHIVKKLLSVFSLINKNGTYHVKVIQIKLLGK